MHFFPYNVVWKAAEKNLVIEVHVAIVTVLCKYAGAMATCAALLITRDIPMHAKHTHSGFPRTSYLSPNPWVFEHPQHLTQSLGDYIWPFYTSFPLIVLVRTLRFPLMSVFICDVDFQYPASPHSIHSHTSLQLCVCSMHSHTSLQHCRCLCV